MQLTLLWGLELRLEPKILKILALGIFFEHWDSAHDLARQDPTGLDGSLDCPVLVHN